MPEYKMIRLKKETHTLLLNQGTMKDSFDSVIKELIINKENLRNADSYNGMVGPATSQPSPKSDTHKANKEITQDDR